MRNHKATMPAASGHPGSRREWRALVLSLPALAIPVAGTFLFPDALSDYEALTWLLALIPAFLLAYYRGWQGVATALAMGMAVLSLTYAVASSFDIRIPDLLFAVVVVYLAVSLGAGWLADRVMGREQEQAIETLALRDPLTDMANRRQAELQLELEIAAAQRGRPLAVVLFDFDNFGDYNAEYGRAAGDAVLKAFGALLTQNTRRMNLAARYGPEEFVCILGGCSEEGALTFAARVQERLRGAEHTVAVPTVSAGISCYAPGVESVPQLLNAAEDALLAAKSQGRDRVRVHGRTDIELVPPAPELQLLQQAESAAEKAFAEIGQLKPANSPDESPIGVGRNALLLLPEPGARARLERILGEMQFRVQSASGWQEALAGLSADYDVAFVELVSDTPLTQDVVQELRARSPGVRIIGVPRVAGDEVSVSLLAVRVDAYNVPTMSTAQLRDTVRTLLRERDAERGTLVRSLQLSDEVRAKEREAKQALALSEAKYRAVVQTVQQVIFTTNREGRWTFLNPAWTAITGHLIEDTLGQYFWEQVHAEERAKLRQEFERLIENRGAHYVHEGRWRTRAGTYRWIEARFQVVQVAGEVESTSGVLTDVTDRRHAEEALRRSEEYFRSLIEHSADMILVANLDGSVRYVSPAVHRQLGYTWEQWYAALQAGELIHDDDVETGLEAFTSVLQHPAETRTIEVRVRHADGSWRAVEVTVGNQLETPGVEGIVVNARDVTERRRAEAALRESQAMLERAQKMDAIGRLAGGVAHDFNNLLTAIQGHAAMLLDEVPEGQPIRRDLYEIRGAAERATTLTRQLLAFSRRQVLQPRVLDLNLIIADMQNMLTRTVGEDRQLVPELNAPLELVRADPSQVEQVVMNLVMNARDALGRGGRIVIRTGNRSVTEEQSAHPELTPGEYVMLEVEDDGEGMTADVASHAFEPFFTTKEAGHGTGLGLATVYGIVKQSGGHVWLESREGEGTKVTLYLPRVAEPLDVAVRTAAAPVRGGTETVLLVEDERAVRELAEEILRRRGYTVLSAQNGREALEVQAAYDGPIHLLLTDVVMPEVDGPQLADRLAKIRPDTLVLFMSGYAEEAIAQHGVIGEGRGFIEKPFTPSDLLRRVRSVLEEPR